MTVIGAEELDQLLPQTPPLLLVQFMESLYVEGLELDREADHGRDAEV